MRGLTVLMVLSWIACGSNPADSKADANATGDTDAATQPSPDAGPEAVRFVVMGDTGTGTEVQYAVADAVKEVCDARGCDFVLLLGDNIYEAGVEGVDDPQWVEKFEAPYADIDLPFYAVLGNHDYGGKLAVGIPGLGNEWHKGPVEVEYSSYSDKWIMPASHYTFRFGNVGIIALDTNAIMWGNLEAGDQAAWYPDAVAELKSSGADWIFAAGHHPYRSNGAHGNAGSYESIEVLGVEVPNPVTDLNGARIKTFFEEHVCGTVHAAFAGHDHNRQWLDEPDALCGAELVVSGAGGKLTALEGHGNAVHFEDDAKPGFLYVVAQGQTLTGTFFDDAAAANFERSIEQ